jgi:hypothetical protein
MGFTGGFLFRVHQKIIVFEIHVKSTNDGEQVSLKITWIYNDFYNDLTGLGSPQFFFQKRVPLKITEDFGLNLSGQESGEIAQQPACFDVAVSHQGGVSF